MHWYGDTQTTAQTDLVGKLHDQGGGSSNLRFSLLRQQSSTYIFITIGLRDLGQSSIALGDIGILIFPGRRIRHANLFQGNPVFPQGKSGS